MRGRENLSKKKDPEGSFKPIYMGLQEQRIRQSRYFDSQRHSG